MNDKTIENGITNNVHTFYYVFLLSFMFLSLCVRVCVCVCVSVWSVCKEWRISNIKSILLYIIKLASNNTPDEMNDALYVIWVTKPTIQNLNHKKKRRNVWSRIFIPSILNWHITSPSNNCKWLSVEPKLMVVKWKKKNCATIVLFIDDCILWLCIVMSVRMIFYMTGA